MGYDLHITRADHWIDSMESPITSDQWLSLVEDDPELTLAPEYGTDFVLWQRSSATDTLPWFDLIDGQIMAKNPDEAMIIKMIEIGGKLKAKVQGDDAEEYTLTAHGLKWQQAAVIDPEESEAPPQQRWWQRWFRRS
jgi:hypothetical protein